MTDDPLGQLLAAYGNDFARLEADLAERKRSMRREREKDFDPTAPIVVEARDLKKTYKSGRNAVHAVRDVSFDVRAGELIAITGPSGSGKSTLLHLLSGLDKPDSGNVNIAGTDITTLSKNKMAAFRCRNIGFVFQFFYLQPFLTLARNVTVPAMFLNQNQPSRDERNKTAGALIDSVGLADRAHHLPKELSGGQMQRAAIARALINRPSLVLADEPTGNLDTQNAQGIMDLFNEIRTQYRTAVVIVTHDPKVAGLADRVVELVDGSMV